MSDLQQLHVPTVLNEEDYINEMKLHQLIRLCKFQSDKDEILSLLKNDYDAEKILDSYSHLVNFNQVQEGGTRTILTTETECGVDVIKFDKYHLDNRAQSFKDSGYDTQAEIDTLLKLKIENEHVKNSLNMLEDYGEFGYMSSGKIEKKSYAVFKNFTDHGKGITLREFIDNKTAKNKENGIDRLGRVTREEDLEAIITSVTRVQSYLLEKGYINFDLNASNILTSLEVNNPIVKVTDLVNIKDISGEINSYAALRSYGSTRITDPRIFPHLVQ